MHPRMRKWLEACWFVQTNSRQESKVFGWGRTGKWANFSIPAKRPFWECSWVLQRCKLQLCVHIRGQVWPLVGPCLWCCLFNFIPDPSIDVQPLMERTAVSYEFLTLRVPETTWIIFNAIFLPYWSFTWGSCGFRPFACICINPQVKYWFSTVL